MSKITTETRLRLINDLVDLGTVSSSDLFFIQKSLKSYKLTYSDLVAGLPDDNTIVTNSDKLSVNLDNIVDDNTIEVNSDKLSVNLDNIVDNQTIGVNSDKLQILNNGILPDKLSIGAPIWLENGDITFTGDMRIDSTGNNNYGFITQSDNIGTGIGLVGDSIRLDNPDLYVGQNGSVLINCNNSNPVGSNLSKGISMGGDTNGGILNCMVPNTGTVKFGRKTTGDVITFFYQDNTNGFLPPTVGKISIGTTSTSYSTASDYRLKEDIINIQSPLEKLKNLKPCNFKWKADGSRSDGFIAHEAQEVVPESVTGEKDAIDTEGNPDYQVLDQSKLIPLLTASLQEALVKIEVLENRLNILET
jgi:signal peptidase I